MRCEGCGRELDLEVSTGWRLVATDGLTRVFCAITCIVSWAKREKAA